MLTESWHRFGRAPVLDAVQIWECVLIQNPVCAFMARFDQAPEVLERHVLGLIHAVGAHGPALVYLDPGDPEQALKRVAAERPAEWLQAVIAYHTQQGYGLRHGLTGFGRLHRIHAATPCDRTRPAAAPAVAHRLTDVEKVWAGVYSPIRRGISTLHPGFRSAG